MNDTRTVLVRTPGGAKIRVSGVDGARAFGIELERLLGEGWTVERAREMEPIVESPEPAQDAVGQPERPERPEPPAVAWWDLAAIAERLFRRRREAVMTGAA